MKNVISRMAIALLLAGSAAGSASAQAPAGLPDYLAGLTGTTPQTPSALAMNLPSPRS